MTEYAVRSLYAITGDDSGTDIFAERIVLFDTNDSNSWIAAAEPEIDEFLRLNPHYRRIGDISGYEMSRAGVIHADCREVWSVLYCCENEDEFVRVRQNVYDPDQDKAT